MQSQRLGDNAIRSGTKNTIVLFGEVLADMFPDQTVLGGAPFNVARHLKAFGQNPVLITRLGHDKLRDEVLDVMSQNGMETLGIQYSNRYPTGRVQVHIKDGAHRFEILPLQAYDFIHPAVVRMAALSVQPSMVYFGTLAQRNDISSRALKTLLRSTDALKFLDINLREPWYDVKTIRQSLHYADIVKLNDEELGLLSVMLALKSTHPPDQAKELMDLFGIEQTIVTCGEAGSWQINRDGEKIEVVAKNKITGLVDTVGAGDGYASVYILGTLLGWPMNRTLERANAFATAICEIRGAIPGNADFYKPFTHAWGI